MYVKRQKISSLLVLPGKEDTFLHAHRRSAFARAFFQPLTAVNKCRYQKDVGGYPCTRIGKTCTGVARFRHKQDCSKGSCRHFKYACKNRKYRKAHTLYAETHNIDKGQWNIKQRTI